jgi:radical SAM protein with 4Fe4S-binding SPASM domain
MHIAEIIKGKGLFPPKRLTVAITTNCNLRCEHCWVECDGAAGQGTNAPTDGITRLIREFVDIGGEEISLTGGEPLMHPDFLEILSFCQSMNLMSIQLQTNATLLTPQFFKSLSAVDTQKLNFQVSLDGATAATHDLVRGQGSFKKAVSGIAQLNTHGYGHKTILGFTEMQHNLNEVPVLLKLAAQTGVASVIGWSLAQHGKALYTESVAPPLPEQYVQMLELYHSDQEFRDLYEQYGRFAAIEWFKGRDQPSTHSCRFIEKPYVSAAGTLYPCVLLQEDAYAAFDLYHRSLDEAIQEKIDDWSTLRAESIKRSKELECFKGCTGAQHCAGGCFARATVVAGSRRGVEDRCRLRRAVYEWHPQV